MSAGEVPLIAPGSPGFRPTVALTSSPVHLMASGRSYHGIKVPEHSPGIKVSTGHKAAPAVTASVGVATKSDSVRDSLDIPNGSTTSLNSTGASSSLGMAVVTIWNHADCKPYGK